MKHIYDALYGYMRINDAEREVIDTPEMQRLRRINQLGLSSLIYPNASHTRFAHSLGVMHLAGKMAESIGLDGQHKQDLRFAGLLHDIGHGPFSHASERVVQQYGKKHEKWSCDIVEQLEPAIDGDVERIKSHIMGETTPSLINGSIDVDRLDYLVRDSYFTGLNHGNIDTETIIQFAEISPEGRLAFDRKAIQAIEGMLNARFHMQRSVYKHHTSLIAETMLEEAMDAWLHQKDCSLDDLMRMDDIEMHAALSESTGEPKVLYENIRNRELFKRCFPNRNLTKEELTQLENKLPDKDALEEQIAERAGVKTRYVLVDKPESPSAAPYDVTVKLANGEYQPLENISPVPEQLREAAWRNTILGVYTSEDKIETVREAAIEEILEESGVDLK